MDCSLELVFASLTAKLLLVPLLPYHLKTFLQIPRKISQTTTTTTTRSSSKSKNELTGLFFPCGVVFHSKLLNEPEDGHDDDKDDDDDYDDDEDDDDGECDGETICR